MEGFAASIVLIAIALGVLLILGALFYLLAHHLANRSPWPPRKPASRWVRLGSILLVLLVIGLWAGLKTASAPPQPAPPPNCPTSGIWVPLQTLCNQ